MHPRQLLPTLLAAVLTGCGASSIASAPDSVDAPATIAPVAQAENAAQDFLARSGFLGFSSVTDKALGQNRYLVFTTRHKLLPADTNGKEDVYLRDLRTGNLSLISVSSSEVQGNGASNSGSISADGRYVAFRSAATNLIAADTNGVDDIFVRDVLLGTTVRVSVSSSGTQANAACLAPAISNKNGANGPFVVFSSTATNLVATDGNTASDIFVRDLAGGTTALVSSNSAQTNSANGGSFDPAITPDGALIAFSTSATDVISGGLNGQRQVVRIDRANPSTRVLISQSASGDQADRPCYEPSVSVDGSKVAFFTLATNLDVATDSNGFFDVYVRDVGANTVSRASVDSGGGESNGHSGFPSISGDGSVVAFASLATDLVADDNNGVIDVFSRTSGVTTRNSVSSAGTEADVDSDLPAISHDGRYIAFRTAATNLIARDPLADDDIDIRERDTPTTFWGTVRCLFPAIWPGFGTASNFSAGTNPAAVTFGDLNGDGILDLAVANNVGSNLSVLFGNGAGSFGAATNFGAGTSPTSVAVGDFNGDGKLDLITANQNSSNVSVLIGNGYGGFAAATNFPVGLNPFALALGDFDRDGDLDLVTASLNRRDISVLLGTGTGSFETFTYFGTGAAPLTGSSSVTAADLNADGILDLAVTNNGTTNVAVLLGNGDGSFGAPTNYSAGLAPFSLTVGDLNGDGYPDLAAANSSSDDVSVLINNGAGVFGPATNFATGTNSRHVRCGDFDGDGDLDLILLVGTNSASVLENNGSASFTTTASLTTGTSARSLTTGDFDGDGDIDFVIPNGPSSVSVYLNQACP